MKTVWMNFHAVFIYENNYKMYNFILNVKCNASKCNASKLTKIFRQRKIFLLWFESIKSYVEIINK